MADEEQMQQPQIRTSPYMSPMQQYGSSILLLTNPENEMYKMELTFRSERLDKNGEPFASGVPLMNDYGINSVIGQIQSVVNQVGIMGNLEMNEVIALLDNLADTLAQDLMVNVVPYGIKSTLARTKIYTIAINTCYICLKRAFHEGDRRFWKGSVQEIYTKSQADTKKGGILSAINPFKKS
jgi:hypothetical protein